MGHNGTLDNSHHWRWGCDVSLVVGTGICVHDCRLRRRGVSPRRGSHKCGTNKSSHCKSYTEASSRMVMAVVRMTETHSMSVVVVAMVAMVAVVAVVAVVGHYFGLLTCNHHREREVRSEEWKMWYQTC